MAVVVGKSRDQEWFDRGLELDDRVHRMLAARVVGYVDDVNDAVKAAGYAATTRYNEQNDHVVRVTLPGGTVGDLVWDQLCWLIIVYPWGSGTGDNDLTRVLTDDADARPRTVAGLAGVVLDEARRRWSR